MFDTAGEAYDRHIGRYGEDLARSLMAAAGVSAGERALDVGCGPGSLTMALAAVLGAGRVSAVDPSPSFVAACRARNPGVEVEVASAEQLPFADAAFDHALAQLVVNFMQDPVAGVSEMKRVTRLGGRVSAAVWDYRQGMTLLRRFWDAVVALDPSAAAQDEGQSMAYSTPEELRGLWARVGLDAVDVRGVEARARYSGFDDLWYGFEAGAGPSAAYVARLSSRSREALRDEVRRRLQVGEQPFELSARAWVVTGRV